MPFDMKSLISFLLVFHMMIKGKFQRHLGAERRATKQNLKVAHWPEPILTVQDHFEDASFAKILKTYKISQSLHYVSGVAQRERAGPITQRSVVRTHAPLNTNS